MLIRIFVWWYSIDLSELDRPLDAFETLQDFFTRPLPDHARPIAAASLVSPVDATVHAVGSVQHGRFVQFESKRGDVRTLLDTESSHWDGAGFVVLYLSPGSYHRVHAPCSGRVQRRSHRSGSLWPMFQAAARRIPGLFEGNERLILEIETDRGVVGLVMVAALGVSDISSPLAVGQRIEAGEEIGQFAMGSAVILFTQDANWIMTQTQRMRLGQPLV